MKTSVTAKAYAKVNLALKVCGKRDDGYHEMDMINQSVSLCDTVTVSLREKDISLVTDFDCGGEDITLTAAKEYFAAAGISCGMEISVKKQIPVLGGLGGGSADAAAVLCCAEELFGFAGTRENLVKIAARVGADVPFCLFCGTARVRGKGEKVEMLPNFPNCTVLLAKSGTKSSTAEMFRRLDSEDYAKPDIDGAQRCIEKGDLNGFCQIADNSFDRLYNNSAIKEKMLAGGGKIALLTGSGPVVYGIFNNPDEAAKVKAQLQSENTECYLCHPVFE